MSAAPAEALPLSRAFRGCLLAAVVALALLWRLPVTADEWHLLSCDTDSLYHLHRAALAVADYPRVRSVDAYAHFPAGYRVHWLAPLTFGYATVLRAAGIEASDLDGAADVLSWTPPLLGIVAILFAVAIARACGSVTAGLCAAVLIAVDPNCYRTFYFGFIDHHMFATLAVLGLVLARLRRSLPLWWATAFVALATTPEATYLVAVLLGVLGLAEIAAIERDSPEALVRRAAWLLAPGSAAALALALARRLESDPLPLDAPSWLHFTSFHPIFLFCEALVLLGIIHWVDARRRRSGVDDRLIAIALVGGALIAGAALLALTPSAVAEITARLAKSDRLIVTEERSVVHVFGLSPWVLLMVAGGLASLGCAAGALRRRAPSHELFRWLAFTAAFALGLSEVRWLRVVSSLEMVAITILVRDVLMGAAPWEPLPAVARRAAAIAAIAAVTWIVIAPNVRDRAGAHGDFCAEKRVIDEATAWFAQRSPLVGREDDPPWGVVAPWDWGHHLHVFGRVPVVFDPLNNLYDDRRDMIDVLREVWWSRRGEELQAALARYGARYLVLYDPFNEISGILGAEDARKAALVSTGADGGVILGEALNQFAAFRLYASRGLATETGSLQLQFASRTVEMSKGGAESGAGPRLPRLQIYEVKRGATLTGIASDASGGRCSIDFEVRWLADGRTERVGLEVPLDARRRFRYRTALPAPFRAHGFEIPGPYVVRCGTKARAVAVSERAVDRGDVVAWGGEAPPPVVTPRGSPGAAPASAVGGGGDD